MVQIVEVLGHEKRVKCSRGNRHCCLVDDSSSDRYVKRLGVVPELVGVPARNSAVGPPRLPYRKWKLVEVKRWSEGQALIELHGMVDIDLAREIPVPVYPDRVVPCSIRFLVENAG